MKDDEVATVTTDYDTLPYLSLPIAYTQPNRLGAIAQLHGLGAAPEIEGARVLELGCANGGNLLPLAARWPKAHFVGFDLSSQQIADGQKRIAYFGLKNVRLAQADLADLHLEPQSFDYVICHGVFSWVPPAVQVATLKLIGHCLSERGVAAISFNVAPGWHLRSPVREYLRYKAGQGAPGERVDRARAALAALAHGTGPGAYGALMRAEAKLLEKIPSSYILGEFLADENHAITFQDFVTAVKAHDLSYISDADLDADARLALSADGARHVEQLAQTDRERAAQELDFLSGRPFRRALLTKYSAERRPAAPTPARLEGLHLLGLLRRDPSEPSDERESFVDRHGRRVAARTPELGALLSKLTAAYPATLSVDTLLKDAGENRDQVARALLSLVQSGRALASTRPTMIGRATETRPQVWRYARGEAALGLPGVTSLQHVTVALPKAGAAIAATADGTRTKAELATLLDAEIKAGRVRLPDETQPIDAQSHVETTLNHLAASAVLEINDDA